MKITIKIQHNQLQYLIAIMGEMITQSTIREAINRMDIERYIVLHSISEVIQKLGKKQYDFKENYNIKLSPVHAASLLIACAERLNTETDKYLINTLRIIINQIEQKL